MPVLCDNCFPARETLVSPLIAGVVKESYMHLPNRELIYLSLSEARLACFKHHLDEKPMFQIAVSTVMNLSGKSGIRYITTRSSLLKTWNFFTVVSFAASQYIDAIACFLDVDQSHILSNGDWVGAVEQVLKTDKIAAMPGKSVKIAGCCVYHCMYFLCAK